MSYYQDEGQLYFMHSSVNLNLYSTYISVYIPMHVVNTLHLQNCQLTLYNMYIELGRKSIVKKGLFSILISKKDDIINYI